MMSNDRRLKPQPGTSKPTVEFKKVGRFQTGVRSLIVLVATCGALMWTARTLWENQHPAFDAARGLNAKSPSERIDSIWRLEGVDIGDAGLAIPPLAAALERRGGPSSRRGLRSSDAAHYRSIQSQRRRRCGSRSGHGLDRFVE